MPNVTITAYLSEDNYAKYLKKKKVVMPKMKEAVKKIMLEAVGGE